MKSERIVSVPVGKLVASPFNPRTIRDDARQRQLNESVKHVGILNALIVRKVEENYETLGGSRRLLAAKAAGKADVPCRVVEIDDDGAREIALIDNVQRDDMHPLDEAKALADLLERSNGDYQGVAEKLAKPRDYVAQRVVLLKLTPPLREFFLSGRIALPHAFQFARLSEHIQKALLKTYGNFKREVPSPKELGAEIRKHAFMDLKAAPWRTDDAELHAEAGPCSTCPKRSGCAVELFAELGAKGDTCTDSTCFETKMERHIALRIKEAKAKDRKFVRISDNWQKPGNGILGHNQWRRAEGKKCEATCEGIYVDPYDQKRGRTLPVCTDATCKTHGVTSASSLNLARHKRSESEVTKERKLREKQKTDTALRSRVLDGILSSPKLWRIETARRAATIFYDGIWHENRKLIAKRHSLLPEKGKGASRIDFDPLMRKEIAKMEEPDLKKLLVELSLVGTLKINVNYPDPGKPLYDTAKLLDIKVDSLRKTVTEAAKEDKAQRKLKKGAGKKKSVA